MIANMQVNIVSNALSECLPCVALVGSSMVFSVDFAGVSPNVVSVVISTTTTVEARLSSCSLDVSVQEASSPSVSSLGVVVNVIRDDPILLEETDKIMKAQIARGADLESGNMIQRAKNMVPILVPLFVSAFRRANDLAMAMEAI